MPVRPEDGLSCRESERQKHSIDAAINLRPVPASSFQFAPCGHRVRQQPFDVPIRTFRDRWTVLPSRAVPHKEIGVADREDSSVRVRRPTMRGKKAEKVSALAEALRGCMCHCAFQNSFTPAGFFRAQ
jgi:hypothetical protein